MKWIVLILVVGGLVLASGPALAQDNQPSQLQQLYWQELAKYNDLINQYNALAAAGTSGGPQSSAAASRSPGTAAGTSGGPQHAPPPAARRLLHKIFAQGQKVEALANALAAHQAGQSGPPPGQ